MPPFNDTLLRAFIERFFGYGAWTAPVWFVGMEEGGGGTTEEVERRIEAWSDRGRNELEDLVAYHQAIGVTRHITDRPALQASWAKMARVLLASRGEVVTTDAVRAYQRDQLGRWGGASCITELLPLPSPGVNDWLYANNSAIPYLATRLQYRRELVAPRTAALQRRIDEHQPIAVVCLGRTYDPYWAELAGAPLTETADGYATVTRNGVTLVAARHPVARGVTNDYFDSIGRAIARLTVWRRDP
jgi:hypothetical protein